MTSYSASGQQLHQRFLALGNMEGKTSDEIVAALGGPSTVIQRAEGNTLMEWCVGGSRVRLNFNDKSQFVEVAHACMLNTALASGGYGTIDAEPVKMLGVVIGAIVALGLLINMFTMFT